MKFIGKYGEYLVLSQLLKQDLEAYLAIKSNQEDYDITLVTEQQSIKRVQVKATELHNKNTNNSVSGIDKKYDYLILVVVEPNTDHIYVMTKSEAMKLKGDSKVFSCSCKVNGEFKVKSDFDIYKNNWSTIKSA